MKEIMAIIRINKINKTRDALASEGFPAFTCVKILGRGKGKLKNKVELSNVVSIEEQDIPKEIAEAMSEEDRLLAKRLITLIVPDEEAPKVIDTIINVNKTGHPGDGKIFVLPINDAIRVRTAEKGNNAII